MTTRAGPAASAEPRLARVLAGPFRLFAQTAGARLAGMASGALLVVLLGRGLPPDAYGVYAVLTTTAVFGSLVLGLNLNANVQRRVPGQDVEEARRIFGTMLLAETGLGALLAGALFLTGADRLMAEGLGIAAYLGEVRLLLPIMVADLAVGSALQFLLARKRFSRANGLMFLRASALGPLLLLWRLAGGRVTLRAVVGCWAAGTGLALLFAGYAASLPRALRARPDWRLLRPAVPFGVLVGFQSVTFYFLKLADRYFLARTASLHDTGVYSFAYTLSNIVYSLTANVAMMLYYPHVTEAHNRGDARRRNELLAQLTRAAFALVAAASLCAAFAAPKMIFFARPEYGESAALIPWLLVALLAVVAGYPPSVLLVLEGRLAQSLACGVLGLGVALACDVLLIPRWSYWGALAATTAGFSAVAAAQNTVAGTWRMLGARSLLRVGSDLRALLGGAPARSEAD